MTIRHERIPQRGWCAIVAAGLTKAALGVVLLATVMFDRASHGQIACRYEVAAVIQAPTGPFGIIPTLNATAISPNGQYIVGYYTPALADYSRAFCYDMQTQQFMTLPVPSNVYQLAAYDVSDAGNVVGSYWVTGGVMPQRGYIFDLESNQYVTELLPHPGASWCVITSINATGTVCGTRSIGSKGDPVNPRTAFIWSAKDGFTDLGLKNDASTRSVGINDEGQVGVGVSGSTTSLVWDGWTVTAVPALVDAAEVFPQAIGSEGELVGTTLYFGQSDLIIVPFLYMSGKTIPLPRPGGAESSAVARGLNASGVIAGSWSAYSGSSAFPCLWWNGEVFDLTTRLAPSVTIPIGAALGISDDGLIMTLTGLKVAVLRASPGLTGDLNCDAIVNHWDLLEVVAEWGKSLSLADLNSDGIVGVADLLTVIVNWSH